MSMTEDKKIILLTSGAVKCTLIVVNATVAKATKKEAKSNADEQFVNYRKGKSGVFHTKTHRFWDKFSRRIYPNVPYGTQGR